MYVLKVNELRDGVRQPVVPPLFVKDEAGQWRVPDRPHRVALALTAHGFGPGLFFQPILDGGHFLSPASQSIGQNGQSIPSPWERRNAFGTEFDGFSPPLPAWRPPAPWSFSHLASGHSVTSCRAESEKRPASGTARGSPLGPVAPAVPASARAGGLPST